MAVKEKVKVIESIKKIDFEFEGLPSEYMEPLLKSN